jgi:hypothetical protein
VVKGCSFDSLYFCWKMNLPQTIVYLRNAPIVVESSTGSGELLTLPPAPGVSALQDTGSAGAGSGGVAHTTEAMSGE